MTPGHHLGWMLCQRNQGQVWGRGSCIISVDIFIHRSPLQSHTMMSQAMVSYRRESWPGWLMCRWNTWHVCMLSRTHTQPLVPCIHSPQWMAPVERKAAILSEVRTEHGLCPCAHVGSQGCCCTRSELGVQCRGLHWCTQTMMVHGRGVHPFQALWQTSVWRSHTFEEVAQMYRCRMKECGREPAQSYRTFRLHTLWHLGNE